jgi:hypothetical protein
VPWLSTGPFDDKVCAPAARSGWNAVGYLTDAFEILMAATETPAAPRLNDAGAQNRARVRAHGACPGLNSGIAGRLRLEHFQKEHALARVESDLPPEKAVPVPG